MFVLVKVEKARGGVATLVGVLFAAFLLGCTSPESEFERAREEGTLQAYLTFLAQYAEKSLIAIDKDSKEAFLSIINLRLKSFEKESQIRRIKKVLKEVEKI